jgi:peptidoglycan/xylan/chitin deacetylase (PgdA/CDA1 family)
MKNTLSVVFFLAIFIGLGLSSCSGQVVSAPMVPDPPAFNTATYVPDATAPPEITPTVEVPLEESAVVCSAFPVHAIPEYNDKNLLASFQTEDPLVVLTIDDGYSNAILEQVLDMLETKEIHATFFLVGTSFGDKIKKQTLVRLIEDGNEIAYHSYAHPDVAIIAKMTYEDWLQDYQKWSESLRAVIGDDLYSQGVVPYARAPYGLWSANFMKAISTEDLIPVYWSADEHAFEPKRIPLKNGSILILHVIAENLDELDSLLNTDWTIISLRSALADSCK